jgi:hypothetical protein
MAFSFGMTVKVEASPSAPNAVRPRASALPASIRLLRLCNSGLSQPGGRHPSLVPIVRVKLFDAYDHDLRGINC